MVKMLTLPVNPAKWSAAKFVVLLLLAAAQVAASTAAYFASAALATWIAGTSFLSPPLVALREAAAIYGASIPMLAVFWMLATVVRTPVFSVGMGFAAIVPPRVDDQYAPVVCLSPVLSAVLGQLGAGTACRRFERCGVAAVAVDSSGGGHRRFEPADRLPALWRGGTGMTLEGEGAL